MHSTKFHIINKTQRCAYVKGSSKIVDTPHTHLNVFQDIVKSGALSAVVVVRGKLYGAGDWYALLVPLQHRQ